MNTIQITNHLFKMKVRKDMKKTKMKSKRLEKNTMKKITRIRSLHKDRKRKNANVD